ncbi:MAG: hypothetical protein M1150_01710 [Patescibacteria group bacterium]|nr:hypothetical protein [Patescibacteria group bacterium]
MKAALIFQKLTFLFLAFGIIFAGAGLWKLDLSKTKANSSELGLSLVGSSVNSGEAIISATIFNTGTENGTINELKISISPGLSYISGTTVGITNSDPMSSQEGDWTALRWRNSFDIPNGNSTLAFRVNTNNQTGNFKAVATADSNEGPISPAATNFTIPVSPALVGLPPGVTQVATTSGIQVNVSQNQTQSMGQGSGQGQQQESNPSSSSNSNPSTTTNPSTTVTAPSPPIVIPQPPQAPQPAPAPTPIVTPTPITPQAKEVKEEKKEIKEVKVEACAGDEKITFEPAHPREGDKLLIHVSSNQPSVNVRLEAVGPSGTSEPPFVGVDVKSNIAPGSGKSDPVWTWEIQNIPVGSFTFRFFINQTIFCTFSTLNVSSKPPIATPAAEIKPEKALPVTGAWSMPPFNSFAFFFSLLSFGSAFISYLKARQYTLPAWHWEKKGIPTQKRWHYS